VQISATTKAVTATAEDGGGGEGAFAIAHTGYRYRRDKEVGNGQWKARERW
jgi:hypothetical protein